MRRNRRHKRRIFSSKLLRTAKVEVDEVNNKEEIDKALKPKLISHLNDNSLKETLVELRRDPFFMGMPPPKTRNPRFSHLAQEGIAIREKSEYKPLSDEEIRKYKEFAKYFVFLGDQFLYVNVKNPEFSYEEFNRRMKMSQRKISEIKRRAMRLNKSIVSGRIHGKVQKSNILKAFGFNETDDAKKMRHAM